jgi:hypothetical protein
MGTYRNLHTNPTVTTSSDYDNDFIIGIRKIGLLWSDIKFSFQTLLDILIASVPPPQPIYVVYFAASYDEIAILFEENFDISEIIFGNAQSVEYSTNNGATWHVYSAPIGLTAGTVRWRVPSFGTNFDGAIIIKGV